MLKKALPKSIKVKYLFLVGTELSKAWKFGTIGWQGIILFFTGNMRGCCRDSAESDEASYLLP